ncbi:hydrogenase maturation nickel metallochaperone HypA/HybF [Streptomyces katsurahamanus]|uniref:Hydrogenase maturation factor HypA n=1 Tax=Streptomyces katsurahamanus TaxID=2577098 RepID=A0ABW9P2H1_9ACTN|nr:hydrogenase maturation nickel metallochaperone HypA [Streptomyces katsurahamanus]MQS39700.1 hydrogenase maturation nickel metallochaperone HypA [Streptomyces katsurahamanus]
MHEMSIAAAVVDQVERAARERGFTAVTAVRLDVGELAGVVPRALDFCFSLVCEGTALEGATLTTRSVRARARCAVCAVEWYAGMPPDLGCPGCGGGTRVELLTGRELRIRGVEWAEGPLPAQG